MSPCAGCCPTALTSCCCLKTYDRDSAILQLLAESTDPDGPSLLGRLCWCQTEPIPRPSSGIEDIEAIRNLAGVTLQAGSHLTAGSLEILRWGKFDAETRTLTATGFGGFKQPWYTGSWTEPAGDPIWCFLMWLARVGNATASPKTSNVPTSSRKAISESSAVAAAPASHLGLNSRPV